MTIFIIGAIYGVFALALGSAVGRMLRERRRQDSRAV